MNPNTPVNTKICYSSAVQLCYYPVNIQGGQTYEIYIGSDANVAVSLVINVAGVPLVPIVLPLNSVQEFTLNNLATSAEFVVAGVSGGGETCI